MIPTSKPKAKANSASGTLTTSGLAGVAVGAVVAALLLVCAFYFFVYRARKVSDQLSNDISDGIEYDDGTIFGVKPQNVRSSTFGQSSPYSTTSSSELTTSGELSHVYRVSASVRQSLQAFQSRLSRNNMEKSIVPTDDEGDIRDAPSMSAVTTRDLDSIQTTVNPVARFRG